MPALAHLEARGWSAERRVYCRRAEGNHCKRSFTFLFRAVKTGNKGKALTLNTARQAALWKAPQAGPLWKALDYQPNRALLQEPTMKSQPLIANILSPRHSVRVPTGKET